MARVIAAEHPRRDHGGGRLCRLCPQAHQQFVLAEACKRLLLGEIARKGIPGKDDSKQVVQDLRGQRRER